MHFIIIYDEDIRRCCNSRRCQTLSIYAIYRGGGEEEEENGEEENGDEENGERGRARPANIRIPISMYRKKLNV